MSKSKYYNSKKSIDRIKKNSISFEELLSRLTPKEREWVEREKKYYKLMMLLREQRKKKGLTQEKLARLANIPRTMITKIESGRRNVTIETLMNIAEAIDKELVISFR